MTNNELCTKALLLITAFIASLDIRNGYSDEFRFGMGLFRLFNAAYLGNMTEIIKQLVEKIREEIREADCSAIALCMQSIIICDEPEMLTNCVEDLKSVS